VDETRKMPAGTGLEGMHAKAIKDRKERGVVWV